MCYMGFKTRLKSHGVNNNQFLIARPSFPHASPFLLHPLIYHTSCDLGSIPVPVLTDTLQEGGIQISDFNVKVMT